MGRGGKAAPVEATLPTCLIAHADRAPEDVFLEVWDEEEGVELRMTYKQLADCMLSGAQWLRAAVGLQQGDFCAMLAHNSAAYLSISFGAMALGAISLNLNWRQPDSTTRTLLEDLGPKVLVASKPFKATATAMHKAVGIKMVLLESICSPTGLPFQPPAPAEATALREEINAMATSGGSNMTAAVFFTGGTTGTPKAVPHTHHSLLWLAEQQRQLFPEPFGDDVPNAGTICFTPFFHVRCARATCALGGAFASSPPPTSPPPTPFLPPHLSPAHPTLPPHTSPVHPRTSPHLPSPFPPPRRAVPLCR